MSRPCRGAARTWYAPDDSKIHSLTAFANCSPQIIHNPGSVPDVAFLNLADSTVIFEDTYHTFQTRVSNHIFSATALSKTDRSKLACVIHSIPEDLTAEDWRGLGQQARRIAGDVFLTDLCEDYYANFAPKWAEFVEAIAS